MLVPQTGAIREGEREGNKGCGDGRERGSGEGVTREGREGGKGGERG